MTMKTVIASVRNGPRRAGYQDLSMERACVI